MECTAIAKHVILSPKKTWGLSRELRGLTYKKAMEVLREVNSKPARIIEKLLRSCFYNGLQKDANVVEDELVVHVVHVARGTMIKRMSPRAQGRANIINKPTTHISVVLKKRDN